MVILKEELSPDRYYIKCNGAFTEIKNGVIYKPSSGAGTRISFFYQNNGEAVHIKFDEVVAEMQKKTNFTDSLRSSEVLHPHGGLSHNTVGDRLVAEVQELKNMLLEKMGSLMDTGHQLHGQYFDAQSNRPHISIIPTRNNRSPQPSLSQSGLLALALTENDRELELKRLEEKERRAMAGSRSKVKYKSLYGREISIDHDRMELISKFARKHTDFIEYDGQSRVSPSRFDTDLRYCNQFLYKLTPMVVIELQDLIELMDRINGQDRQKKEKMLFAEKLGLVDVNIKKRTLFTNRSFKRQRESSSDYIFETDLKGSNDISASDFSTSSNEMSDTHDQDHVLITRNQNGLKSVHHTVLIHNDKISNSPKRSSRQATISNSATKDAESPNVSKRTTRQGMVINSSTASAESPNMSQRITRSSIVPRMKNPPLNSAHILKELNRSKLRATENVAARKSSSSSEPSLNGASSDSDANSKSSVEPELALDSHVEIKRKATNNSASLILLKSSSGSDFENSIKDDTPLSKRRKLSLSQPERVKSILRERSPTSFKALKTRSTNHFPAKGKDKVKLSPKKFEIDQEFAQHSTDKIVGSKNPSESQGLQQKSIAEIRSNANRKSGQFYKVTEDKILIKWVLKKDYATRVSGNVIWKELELKEFTVSGKPVRTWQSLRNRFLKYILLNLRDYGLQYDEEKKIRLAACTGSIKKKQIRLDKKKLPGFTETIPKPSTSRGRDTTIKTNLQDRLSQTDNLDESLAFSEIEVSNFASYSANGMYQNLSESQSPLENKIVKPKRKLFTNAGFLEF